MIFPIANEYIVAGWVNGDSFYTFELAIRAAPRSNGLDLDEEGYVQDKQIK